MTYTLITKENKPYLREMPQMEKPEEWMPVYGWEDLYHVSDFGRVKALPKTIYSKQWPNGKHFPETILSLKPDKKKGYVSVGLCRGKRKGRMWVHRMVALAFIENPESLPQVNHKDGNKANNKVGNLEWSTIKWNIEHSYGLDGARHGENHEASTLKNSQARQMRFLYQSGKFTHLSLANLFGVPKHIAADILKNKTYKRI